MIVCASVRLFEIELERERKKKPIKKHLSAVKEHSLR